MSSFAISNLSKLIDERKIAQRVEQLAREISSQVQDENIIAVCVLKGSFIFYSDLIRQIDVDIRTDFIGCASYGNSHKSSGEVRLTLDLTNGIEDKTVLLVEDIVDTGLTMSFLKKTLEARNPKKLITTALLFKPEALKTDFKPDFVGFEIGSEFVVGYGLDYQGRYRNLPYIAALNNLN